MIKTLKSIVFSITVPFLFAGTGIANSTNDQNLMVLNYDGFFDRMDDLEAPEYSSIKLAFYLKDKNSEPCKVESVQLKTKQKSLDVYLMDDGELLLPFEPKFDQDKAAIVINKLDTSICGLDMRLESTQLFGTKVTLENSLALIATFDTAFSDLGGMMSFMLPSVAGISFLAEQNQKLYLLDTNLGQCSENSCTITKSELDSYGKPLIFNTAPKKSVPYIK